MSHQTRSPLEHGELEASPYHSPDIEIGVTGDFSDQDSNEEFSSRPDDEEDLGPDIKPPQAKVKKDKHKHKHKYDKKKSDRGRDRSDKASKHRSTGESSRNKDQRDRGSGGSRDRRSGDVSQSDKERRARQVRLRDERLREEELLRREKSLIERERLEKLEMERRRLDKEISRREREQHEKLQREKERERDRMERLDRNRTKQVEDEKRRTQTRQNIQSRHDRDKSYVPRSRSPHSRRETDSSYQDRNAKTERSDVEKSRSRPSGTHSSVEPPTPAASKQKVEANKSKANESSEESDSDSDSSSSDDSDTDSDSSSEEESAQNKREKDPLTSKFDSDSERKEASIHSDSDQDSGHHSVQGNHEYMEYLDETPPQSPVELLPDLPPYFPAIQGCRNVEEFNCLNRIEEGTYGVVYRARDKKTDEIVALKRLKMEKEKDGFPITSLREINTLLKAQHPNIVTVREIVVGSNMDRIYIVMDYVEHDLKALMECMKEPFMIGEVKTLMIQLMRGVAHMHDNWIIHRDLKTSNLLLSHSGILKIGDFGLAREYGSPLKQYTPIVVTLWYRSPELLLGTKEYSCPIDMWSVGCIMAEFLTRKPLFPGKSEIDELNKIFKELGTPNEKIWPGVSELKGWKTCTFSDYPYNQLRNRFGGIITDKGFELMNRLLTYNPSRRISAEDGLKHDWFKEGPKPVDPSMFPTWPAKSEQSHHRGKTGNSPKPPSGGKAYSSLLNDDDDKIGFHLPGVAAGGGGGFSLKF